MTLNRDEYTRIVSEFADLIGDSPPLIGDCALLPHPKKSLLYAIRWMIAHYEAEREAATDQTIRDNYEALLPTLGYLFTRLARDWHEIDAEDKDAIARLNQHESFPEWASVLKEKYINEDKASDEAAEAALQVTIDRINQERAARKETAEAELEAAWKVFIDKSGSDPLPDAGR